MRVRARKGGEGGGAQSTLVFLCGEMKIFCIFWKKRRAKKSVKVALNKKEGKRGIRASLTSNIFLISSAETGVRTNL